jgi:hypothetical protein
MKQIISSFLAVFILCPAFAQEPAYSWSSPMTKPAKNTEIQLLGQPGSGYFIVNKQPPEEGQQSILRSAFNPIITVEYINSKQEHYFTKDMTAGRADDYVNAVYFNNKLFIITALYDKDAGKNILWAKGLNADGNVDKPVQIGSIDADKFSKRGRFAVEASPDGSKLFVLAQPEYEKDQQEKIGTSLFTTGFTKMWSSVQTYPYVWSKSIDNRPYVNNAGTCYIVKKMEIKGSNDQWSIFSFDGKFLQEHKLVFEGDRNLASMVTAFSPEGDFTVGGYYTERAKVSIRAGLVLNGSFLYRVDGTGKLLKTAAFNPFEKRKEIVARYILFNNNNIILTGEGYMVSYKAAAKASGTASSAQSMFTYDYSYTATDITVDGFDGNGKPLYATSIAKNNASQNDNGYWLSYFAAIVKGKLVIIFNDDKYNYEPKKIISINSPKVVAYATIDPVTGETAQKMRIMNTGPVGDRDGDMYLRPDAFLKLDATHFISRADNYTNYRMGIISF